MGCCIQLICPSLKKPKDRSPPQRIRKRSTWSEKKGTLKHPESNDHIAVSIYKGSWCRSLLSPGVPEKNCNGITRLDFPVQLRVLN
jgi:hypothetical protein